jgi:hypothetical protein
MRGCGDELERVKGTGQVESRSLGAVRAQRTSAYPIARRGRLADREDAVTPKPHKALDRILADVRGEVLTAIGSFPSFNSPHEGKAVIEEELDELWEHVKANTGRSMYAMDEARQIAAMAVRYMIDLDEA